MKNEDVISFWLTNANDDLESAKIMMNAGRYLYVGFMLQQCIEKALKANYIFETSKQHPFSHNLLTLLEKTKLKEKLTDEQKSIIANLNPLYIETRYMDYKSKISSILTNEYCKDLIFEVKELFEWITEQIK